jgi:hypothetical protein
MKTTLLILFLCLSFNAFAVDCGNVQKVAKEAVAYSLVGAWTPFAAHACFKNEKFEYFKPQLGEPTGEVSDAGKVILFDPKKDSYSIESVKANGSRYDIRVKFTIGGKTILTNYIYEPKPDLAKHSGICGYVVNFDHGIFRKDCVIKSRLVTTKAAKSP